MLTTSNKIAGISVFGLFQDVNVIARLISECAELADLSIDEVVFIAQGQTRNSEKKFRKSEKAHAFLHEFSEDIDSLSAIHRNKDPNEWDFGSVGYAKSGGQFTICFENRDLSKTTDITKQVFQKFASFDVTYGCLGFGPSLVYVSFSASGWGVTGMTKREDEKTSRLIHLLHNGDVFENRLVGIYQRNLVTDRHLETLVSGRFLGGNRPLKEWIVEQKWGDLEALENGRYLWSLTEREAFKMKRRLQNSMLLS